MRFVTRMGTTLLMSVVLCVTCWTMGYMLADGAYAAWDRLHPPPPRVVVWEPLSPKPMWCEEDEALVWYDAPHTAHCVNIEQLVREENVRHDYH